MDMDPKDLPENNADGLPQNEGPKEAPDPELFVVRKPSLIRWLLLGTLGLAAMVALIVSLVLPALLDEPEHVEPVVEVESPVPAELAYEEPRTIDLQAQAIRLDALITRTLMELEAQPDSIEAFAFPAKGNEDFRARSLGFVIDVDPIAFQKHLGELLLAEEPKALLTPSGPRQFSIIVDGIRTHELFLELPSIPAYSPTIPELPAEIKGRLAIVIDDMGEDTRLARGLAETGMEITFAVWPFSSHRDAVRSMAKEYGLDLIVHLPMEPRSYPENDPGPGALFTTMTADEIASTVKTNLALVPEAIGVNNHMGSKFTADMFAMTAALGEMMNHGLFFLDSRTTGKSKGADAARATGIPFYGRDVFIDNEKSISYIVGQLSKAERIARRTGSAIAIGHPHKETLKGIKAWAAQAGKDIAVVRLSSLKTLEN